MNRLHSFILSSLFTVSLSAWAPTSQASVIFHVDVTTSPLTGSPSAPFYLDYQLNDGSGTQAVPNTAIISNFTFAGGGFTGNPTLFGDATGTVPTQITLSDANFFSNEFIQAFTPGTKIGFDVSLTTNVDPTAPDSFSFSILDKNLEPIATEGVGDTLVLADLSSQSLSQGDIEASKSISPAGVSASISVAVIPEVNAVPALLAVGVLVASFEAVRKRSRKVQTAALNA